MPGAKALMVQGAGSDVGKSLIVAGLCRAARNRGLRVLPFKPQNMSNNAAAVSGGEIGRAQALQARACRAPASVHMNPVLLKPQSEIGAQVVVQGRVLGTAKAREYQTWKPKLMPAVLESFERLRAQADLVVAEGAGSCSEINLRAHDIANMGFARAADLPVVVVGDIDRGGVIAQIVGAHAVLERADAALVVGFIVNKFRGDATLFADAMRMIEERTGWPSLGLMPFFAPAARLPAEDALALARRETAADAPVTIAVPLLPHIANFDEFDPLKSEPGVRLLMLRAGEPIPAETDLVILPGSKATIADLDALRAEGWDVDVKAHARRGGKILGICGGYQMLGSRLADPLGIEGAPGERSGLALLDVATTLTQTKTLGPVVGLECESGAPFEGYEMHVGETSGADAARPVLRFADGREDGACSCDGQVRGVYVHGLFGEDAQRAIWLKWIGAAPSDYRYEEEIERTLDALAAHLESHLDIDRLLALAR